MQKIKRTHLGIYALIEKGTRLLLVKKTRGPYDGKWDLPGGSPVHGETIFQTLVREVREETGIVITEAIPHSNQAFCFDYEDGEQFISFHHTCLIYKAIVFDESAYRDSINEEDVSGCSWIEKLELEKMNISCAASCTL